MSLLTKLIEPATVNTDDSAVRRSPGEQASNSRNMSGADPLAHHSRRRCLRPAVKAEADRPSRRPPRTPFYAAAPGHDPVPGAWVAPGGFSYYNHGSKESE